VKYQSEICRTGFKNVFRKGTALAVPLKTAIYAALQPAEKVGLYQGTTFSRAVTR
jgi:hypothetical protein